MTAISSPSISALPVSSLNGLQSQRVAQPKQLTESSKLTKQDPTAKDAFQDFVAGTFYKMMLKSLRSTEQKNPYFDGGYAEEVFKGQLDQQIAEDLAKEHGDVFSDKLFQVYTDNFRAAQRAGTTNKVAQQIKASAASLSAE